VTVYYALGGGWGHRTRAERVLAALEIEGAEIIATGDVPPAFDGNPEAHRRWLIDRFEGRRVIVDVFPAGLQGELSGIEGVGFDYVARLLRWDEYRRAVPHTPPGFGTTYVVEALTAAHAAFVQDSSRRVVSLPLAAPRLQPPSPAIRNDYSLVVHSGPAEEVLELLAYARELCDEPLFVATRCKMALPPDCAGLVTHRPFDYFAGATRIISAAGFNLMMETEPWRSKHHVLPLPRRFDDQYLRAARRRQGREGVSDAAATSYGRVAPAASSSALEAAGKNVTAFDEAGFARANRQMGQILATRGYVRGEEQSPE